ncbi:hypothetical protein [Halobaculum sp. D14]|uniref:hypothetical protein n=1 Tax=Halobaculum sp. D14 TaxID=3421642 RepID=UPI003EBE6981
MRVLVIDQCSNDKDLPDDCDRLSESEVDNHDLEELLQKDDTVCRRARNLYDGRQQRLVTEAVDQMTTAEVPVDRYFVSAGFGLVPENQELPAYNVKFQNNGHARRRGREMGLPDDVANHVEKSEESDIIFFLLGATYYEAIDVENAVQQAPEDVYVVVFNRDELVADRSNALSLTANTKTGSKYGGGAIGVKGTYMKNFAANVAAGATVTDITDIESYCTTPPTEQAGFEQFSDP